MIDLYKLQIFTAVAQESSFSAAADRLNITQSAVSQHMKDLEVLLGRQLFRRGRRGVTLTPHGEILQRYAGDIFALVAQAESALTNVAQLSEGRISIGATPGVAVYLAPEWIGRFRERYPRLSVALQTGITGRIISAVLTGRLDMGIIEGELDGYYGETRLAWRPLAEIEQLLVIGRDHAWAQRSSVRLADLHQQPMIMRQPGSQSRVWLDGALRPRGVVPTVATEFDNLESMKRSVAQGSCLTVLPEYVVRNEVAAGILRAIPIEGRPLLRTLKLVWLSGGYFSPVARAFLFELSAEFPALEAVLAGGSGPALESSSV